MGVLYRAADAPRQRDGVARRLRDMLDAANAETATLAAVYGDIGHGKTTLLDDITGYAARTGHRVVSMHGDIPDKDIPYAGVHWLLSRNVDLLDRYDNPAARLLRQVLVDFTPPDSVLSMCSSVMAWFECLAPDTPLLVAVDDADQLDEQSLRVLAFVSSRQQSGRSSVILTATNPIPLFERIEAQRFRLDDLDSAAALDVAESVGASTDTAHRLVDRLGGNPLALIRVGERVVSGDVVLRESEPLPLPSRLQNDVEERAETLPPAARQLLEVAAATRETDLTALDSWSVSRNRGPIGGLLDAAEDAGIVDFDGRTMSWRRRWMAEAILRRCTDCRIRRLRQEFGSGEPAQPTRAAAHLDALTPGERRVTEVVVDGASTRKAAHVLGLSEKTVESHLQSIYRKLDVRSRSQLVAVALRGSHR